MREKTVEDIVDQIDAEKAHAAAHLEGIKATVDLEKAKGALMWIAAAWAVVAPPAAFITWLVIR